MSNIATYRLSKSETYLIETALDFIAVSNYWGWGKSFEYYQAEENVILDEWALNASQAIKESPHSDHIRVIVCEFGSITWSPETWPDLNNLGHAIVSFDMAGQFLCNKSVEFAMLWGTRYMEGELEKNWYAMGNQNEILPAGQPLAIWGHFIKSKMVQVSGLKRSSCYASFEPQTKSLTVFIINKDSSGRKINIEIKATNRFSTTDVYQFAGTGDKDMKPTWSKVATIDVSNNLLEGVGIPGTSITVLDMKPIDY